MFLRVSCHDLHPSILRSSGPKIIVTPHERDVNQPSNFMEVIVPYRDPVVQYLESAIGVPGL
jgi:hypothetical protein